MSLPLNLHFHPLTSSLNRMLFQHVHIIQVRIIIFMRALMTESSTLNEFKFTLKKIITNIKRLTLYILLPGNIAITTQFLLFISIRISIDFNNFSCKCTFEKSVSTILLKNITG